MNNRMLMTLLCVFQLTESRIDVLQGFHVELVCVCARLCVCVCVCVCVLLIQGERFTIHSPELFGLLKLIIVSFHLSFFCFRSLTVTHYHEMKT